MLTIKKYLFAVLLFALLFLATGCSSLWLPSPVDSRTASSSLVNFLYPNDAPLPEHTSKSKLNLPLRVGLAFVPGERSVASLNEADKNQLLERVRTTFLTREYIGNIVVIPQNYLQQENGTHALTQLGRLYQVDVIGLVSYDQTVVLEDRKSSIFYWTIVGAYLVKGNKNDVSTFVDLAVVDVSSRRLLLRAGGTHSSEQNLTYIDAMHKTRNDRQLGFSMATDTMITNFAVELENFEKSITTNENVEIVRRRGGGGSINPGLLLVLSLFIARRHISTHRAAVSHEACRHPDRLHDF